MTGPLGAALLEAPVVGGMGPADAATPDEWLLAMYDSGAAKALREGGSIRNLIELCDDHDGDQCERKGYGTDPEECRYLSGATT